MANNIRKEGQGRSWSLTGEGMTYSKVIDPFKAVYEVKIRKGVYGTEGFACTVWVKKGETKVAHFVTLSDVARDLNKPTKIHRFSRKHSGQYWLTVDSTTVQTFGHFSFLPVGPNMSSRAASSSGKGDWEVICLAFQAPEEGVNTSSLEAYSFVGSEKRKLKLEFQGDTKTYKLQEASENDMQLSREVLGAPIIVENKRIGASNSGRWSVVGVLGLSEEGEFCPYFVSSEIFGQLENTTNPSGEPEVDAPGGLHQVLPTGIQEVTDQLNRSLLEDLMMIEEHPKSQRRQEGSKVELKCKVKGGNAGNEVIYQWFKDITLMEGKTSSSLIFDPVRVRDFGVYKCEVRRSRTDQRYLASDEAELDVTPRDGISYSKLSTVFSNYYEVKEEVASELSREISGRKTWKQVAAEYNVKRIHLLEREKVPGDGVIESINAQFPNLTVYDFCKTLKKVRRLDIVEILLDHLCSPDA